jgi:hypothetical protein
MLIIFEKYLVLVWFILSLDAKPRYGRGWSQAILAEILNAFV